MIKKLGASHYNSGSHFIFDIPLLTLITVSCITLHGIKDINLYTHVLMTFTNTIITES